MWPKWHSTPPNDLNTYADTFSSGAPDFIQRRSKDRIARRVAVRIAALSKDYSSKFPTITVSKRT